MAARLWPGGRFGRYQIEEELGKGGMSTVFRAYDADFARRVALKVLPPHLLKHSDFRHRFMVEARIIASLEHHAIVPVYDVGEVDEVPYLAMRYMTGGDAQTRLSDKPFTLVGALPIVRRVGAALDEAHRKEIIHRDVKPANFFFDDFGDTFLGDFGIAFHEDAREEEGTMVGTPGFMAPEAFLGEGMANQATRDIYALTVSLFQMVTGRLPYVATSADWGRLMIQHLEDPIPDLRETRADIPDAVQQVIEKGMAKKPEDRFKTATALIDAYETAVRYPHANQNSL